MRNTGRGRTIRRSGFSAERGAAFAGVLELAITTAA